MVAVFSAFVVTGVPAIKEIGLGLAVAIAVDATITRLVLVPATMVLLGDANWYLPRWLDRRLAGRLLRAARGDRELIVLGLRTAGASDTSTKAASAPDHGDRDGPAREHVRREVRLEQHAGEPDAADEERPLPR